MTPMAIQVVTTTPGDHVPTADQRVVTHGVPWAHYEAHLALRGEHPVPRIAYLEGAMELMSPSKEHERIKSYLGRLIEAYAFERGIDLSPYGAWTLKNPQTESGLEPDECYLVGDQHRDVPDLAIEVAWTSGGIDKLEIYRRLGVKEVWVWKASRIEVNALRAGRYEIATRSVLFPDLDVHGLSSYLEYPTVIRAVAAFRDTLS
jgi:Uma2 family endonuclease